MKTFIVGFSRSVAWYKIGSTVIQEVEKRNFSHVYIRYTDCLTSEQIISQASHGFVNETNFEIFKKENIVVKEYQIECSEEQYMEMMKFIKKYLGAKYSKLQILMIGVKKLLHLKTVKDFDKTMEFICSEWGSRICKIVGFDEFPENLDTYTPSDMDKTMEYLDSIYDRINLLNK
jgi:hypothetical protein